MVLNIIASATNIHINCIDLHSTAMRSETESGCILLDLPAVDASVGGGEVDADSEEGARVVGERAGVAFVFDLREGLVRSGVGLDLDDVDVVLCLDEDVYASV